MVVDIVRVASFCNHMCVSFVKRECNFDAHLLAKFTKSVFDYVTWLEDPSNWLKDCLLRDVYV